MSSYLGFSSSTIEGSWLDISDNSSGVTSGETSSSAVCCSNSSCSITSAIETPSSLTAPEYNCQSDIFWFNSFNLTNSSSVRFSPVENILNCPVIPIVSGSKFGELKALVAKS